MRRVVIFLVAYTCVLGARGDWCRSEGIPGRAIRVISSATGTAPAASTVDACAALCQERSAQGCVAFSFLPGACRLSALPSDDPSAVQSKGASNKKHTFHDMRDCGDAGNTTAVSAAPTPTTAAPTAGTQPPPACTEPFLKPVPGKAAKRATIATKTNGTEARSAAACGQYCAATSTCTAFVFKRGECTLAKGQAAAMLTNTTKYSRKFLFYERDCAIACLAITQRLPCWYPATADGACREGKALPCITANATSTSTAATATATAATAAAPTTAPTTAPAATTSAPAATTSAPAATTSAPAATIFAAASTRAPAATPGNATTAQPAPATTTTSPDADYFGPEGETPHPGTTPDRDYPDEQFGPGGLPPRNGTGPYPQTNFSRTGNETWGITTRGANATANVTGPARPATLAPPTPGAYGNVSTPAAARATAPPPVASCVDATGACGLIPSPAYCAAPLASDTLNMVRASTPTLEQDIFRGDGPGTLLEACPVRCGVCVAAGGSGGTAAPGPSNVTTPAPANRTSGSTTVGTGAGAHAGGDDDWGTVGLIVGCVVGGILLLVLCCVCCKRRARWKRHSTSAEISGKYGMGFDFQPQCYDTPGDAKFAETQFETVNTATYKRSDSFNAAASYRVDPFAPKAAAGEGEGYNNIVDGSNRFSSVHDLETGGLSDASLTDANTEWAEASDVVSSYLNNTPDVPASKKVRSLSDAGPGGSYLQVDVDAESHNVAVSEVVAQYLQVEHMLSDTGLGEDSTTDGVEFGQIQLTHRSSI